MDVVQDKDILFDEISDALPEVTRLLAADRPISGGDWDFTLAQLRVLRALPDHGNCTIGDVARRLGVTRRAVAGLAERLVQRGLIARATGILDRRVVYLQLASAGKEARAALRLQSRRRLQAAAESFSIQQLEQISSGVSLLRDALAQTEAGCALEQL
jgi:DNA-binding MarR family transcriptional regulator